MSGLENHCVSILYYPNFPRLEYKLGLTFRTNNGTEGLLTESQYHNVKLRHKSFSLDQ